MEQKNTASNEFEGVIRAYVTNLKKYNEGALVGQWVDFPTNAEKMQEVFKNIGIDHVKYEETFISDVESDIAGLANMIREDTPLNEVNYLAHEIQNLEPSDTLKYEAVLSDCVSNIQDAINLTSSLDNFDYNHDVTNDADLGYYYVEESGIYDTESMGTLANYIDYESFGQDCRLEEGGYYTDCGYMRQGGDIGDDYDGINIPDEYIVTYTPQETIKESEITVLLVEPNKQAKEITMPNTLKDLQQAVGGMIADCSPYSDLGMIINDEGKILNMDLNRALLNKNGQVQDIVAGTMIIAGVDEQGSYASLTPEQKEKSLQNFKYPEAFIKINDEIKSIKIPELPEKKENPQQQEQQKKSEPER